MRVTAVRKGYFGGKIRDAGEGFSVPDALMGDERLRPSWVEAAGGASAPHEPEEGGETISRKRGRKPKQVSPSADETTPAGNGISEALGGPPPDWLPGDITN
jgi:hypothetical protein